MIYEVTVAAKTYRVELVRSAEGWHCKLDGRPVPLEAITTQPGVLSMILNGKSYEAKIDATSLETSVIVGRQRFEVAVRDPRSFRSRQRADASGHGVKKIVAPMPGKVVRILLQAGTAVEAGQSVLVIEAMKMQNELKSPKKGVILKLSVSEGAAVEAGQTLAEVE